jgi:hypothetical protein
MNARNKLNGAYLNGAALFAGAVGLVTQSGAIFCLALIGLLISSLVAGHIRLTRK